MKQLITITLSFILLLFVSCKKDNNKGAECVALAVLIERIEPYTMPVWHPNGQLIGYNHSPIAGITKNGTEPCASYISIIKHDSTGFYLINKDGTGIKRCTNFKLISPAWSPDGNWIAFSLPPHIYKMRFDGNNFDTAHIIQLTDSGENFFPCWAPEGDTIYYNSNVGTPAGTNFHSIWKMANDGNAQQQVSPQGTYGRQPFVANNNMVYFVDYFGMHAEIFSMNKDGSNKIQVTFNGKNRVRRSPKFYQNKVYYLDAGIYSTPVTNYVPVKICNGGSGSYDDPPYDISVNGEIVYETELGIRDRKFGTLWITNADGTNNHQLTFNHY